MFRRLFCKHEYQYLGCESWSDNTDSYKIHYIYCPKCRKTVIKDNKTYIDILLKKSKIDKEYEKLKLE